MTDERLFGVLGHEHAQARLHRAIGRGQLHHGLIVVGPRGVGKARLARGLACALHCAVRYGEGCGACTACRRVLAGTHAGVEWVRPEEEGGAIKVAVARELANRLELAPFEGRHHVVVFDPAEGLTEQAYNALLKAVEEPRPGVHFVMLTQALDALLPTILSRCLAIRLGRLEDADVRTIVETTLRGQPDVEPPDEARLELAVRLASGSAGLACELALDPALDAALALLRAWVEAAARGAPAIFAGEKSALWSTWNEAIGSVKTGRPARERAVATRVAELWLLHLREHLRGRSGLPGVPAPRDASTRVLLHQLDVVGRLLEGMSRNPNVRLALENALLDLG